MAGERGSNELKQGSCPPRRRCTLYLRLLAAPSVLSLIDGGVTLYYQPPEYWLGDRSAVVEGNPFVWVALRVHPLLLVPGFVGWYALFGFLIFATPAWIGLRFHAFLVLAHLTAIAGWLLRHNEHGLPLTALLLLTALPAAAALAWPFRHQWEGQVPVRLPAAAGR